MNRNGREVLQIMGVVILMMMALIFLAWLFVSQPDITDNTAETTPQPTQILEIKAPEGVRCFVMLNSQTRKPEDFTCVTTETQERATSGVKPHQLARMLTF